MSKIILLGDTHFGVRGDRDVFLDNHKRFLDDVFFPYLSKYRNQIRAVVHLGDLVDRRKYVNISTLKRLRDDFLAPLSEFALDAYFIAGNHDLYYRNTNNVCSLEQIAAGYGEVVVNEPAWIPSEHLNFMLAPWICDENRALIMKDLSETSAEVLLGHFELTGFEMHGGAVTTHGDDPKLLEKFDLVCSGHYHHRSRVGNVQYIGAFGQYTWSDWDDARGFAVLETSNRTLEFIDNPYSMFERIEYSSTVAIIKPPDVTNKFVKLIVHSENEYLEPFISILEGLGPTELQVLRGVDTNLTQLLEEAEVIDATLETFHSVIDEMGPDVSKEALKRLVAELYSEAMFGD